MATAFTQTINTVDLDNATLEGSEVVSTPIGDIELAAALRRIESQVEPGGLFGATTESGISFERFQDSSRLFPLMWISHKKGIVRLSILCR